MRKNGRFAAAALLVALAGCASVDLGGGSWTPLVDAGRGLENFNRVNEANWTVIDGTLSANTGGKDPAYLVTKVPYRDFVLRAEFWASDDANSGIFFRCQEPGRINDENCYEANIFDQRPDPVYSTGAIVKVAPVREPYPKAGGKWNTYEITARGPQLTLVLNGVKTVDIRDAKFASGPIALQWGRGLIRWRKVEVRPL
jgi:hypothetical protein